MEFCCVTLALSRQTQNQTPIVEATAATACKISLWKSIGLSALAK
jgi:hypothetical protein